MADYIPFSPVQLNALDVAARVSSCLSLLGSLLTIVSFIGHPPLRKPVNRLAFCIAVANAFSCLAYSWGRYPIGSGRTSALCQTQGFFITWFVMTDPLLVTVMAVNVYLRVRTRRTAAELRKFDAFGIGLAFTLPFVVALSFLAWRPHGRTVYGDAVLWCWISRESDLLRLVAFYIPVWIMILTSLVLFGLGGNKILQARKEVKSAARPDGVHLKLALSRPLPAHDNVADAPAWPGDTLKPMHLTVVTTDNEVDKIEIEHLDFAESRSASLAHTPSPPASQMRSASQARWCPDGTSRPSKTPSRFAAVHWKYAKFTFLCTMVLFVTWIPISINRVYNTFVAPSHQIYGLYLASAICIPLHGFGNFLIYSTISWTECRQFVSSLFSTQLNMPSFKWLRSAEAGDGLLTRSWQNIRKLRSRC